MTLNEKLDIITDLENENLSEELIESMIEQLECPKFIDKRYKSVKELIEDLENDEE